MLGSIAEAVCLPLGIEPPIFRRRVDFFTKSRAFNIAKARAKLGYAPSGSFEEEVQLIAKWYEEHGWLAAA
jgi:nucleoside-diphosphate-sugar epimerase